jgi:predicted regulator of Ras-like GTPase activity (Roadblock/LC7/MglB family)
VITNYGDLGWMLDSFAERAPDVSHAIAISADGLMVAWSACCAARRRSSTRER